YGNSPELMVVDSRIFTEKIAAAFLHGCKNGSGYFGEILELFFEVLVFFCFCDEGHIGKCMSHFMEPDIAIRRLPRNAFDEIIPGKIDAALVHMAHKRTGIESIVIVILQHINVIE